MQRAVGGVLRGRILTNRVAPPVKALLAAALACSTVIVAPAQPVAAHCPGTPADGTPPRDYAGAYQYIAPADAVYAIIQYVNPVVCSLPTGNAFSLEGVGLCNDSSCGGFVQVGWWKWQFYSSPHWYCEFKPIGATIQQYFFTNPVTPEDHTYWWERRANTWYCNLGTTNSWIPSNQNWTSGTYLHAQGETNSTHSQIGKTPYPNAILFWAMQYRAGAWYTTDLYDLVYEWPHWVVEPTPGQMKNGTYTPH